MNHQHCRMVRRWTMLPEDVLFLNPGWVSGRTWFSLSFSFFPFFFLNSKRYTNRNQLSGCQNIFAASLWATEPFFKNFDLVPCHIGWLSSMVYSQHMRIRCLFSIWVVGREGAGLCVPKKSIRNLRGQVHICISFQNRRFKYAKTEANIESGLARSAGRQGLPIWQSDLLYKSAFFCLRKNTQNRK